LTDELASRVHDPDGAGFSDAELAVLHALPQMKAELAELALDALKPHFDEGEIGQIVHAYGMYKGLHTTMAVLGAEILDQDGRPLSEQQGFGVVTMNDGSFRARSEVDLP